MDKNFFSVGAVNRNHLDGVVGEKAFVIRNPGSVKRAELLAILSAWIFSYTVDYQIFAFIRTLYRRLML